MEENNLHIEEKLKDFLNSYDFMRLGQAIAQGNQNMAMMIVSHLQQAAQEAGVAEQFGMNLQGIRQCVIGRDMKQAQDILAVVTAKRVKLINDREEKKA